MNIVEATTILTLIGLDISHWVALAALILLLLEIAEKRLALTDWLRSLRRR